MIKDLTVLVKNIHHYAGVTDDSRKVGKNFIFVAVRGLASDGHRFISEAVKKGAGVVVGEEKQEIKGADYVRVADSREALGKLASEFYGNPSRELKVIGVTGTKGKTTTCHLIYHVLTQLGEKVGLLSSISVPGFHVTTPEVVSLHKFLREMVEAGCKYAVVEVSSHGIDQKRIAGVQFDVAVLTNIAPEHLDYHRDLEEYKKIKMAFVHSAKKQVVAPTKTSLDILPGEFNNLNVEAALAAVAALGIGRKEALETLSSFKLPEGRLEEVKGGNNFRVFIDFAHTPESLEAALTSLKGLAKGKLIAVFGAAGERDSTKRPRMGAAAAKLADVVILTAEDPRSEVVKEIIAQIRSGIKNPKVEVYEIPDREEAIKRAIGLAQKGDIVGLFGKGHEQSMNLDGVHETPWSEREIVRKYIQR
jgi:UDP-N-acetylmuramoyl-L-alanyl-D-glutamate--2,6-diaminopimelate ligase